MTKLRPPLVVRKMINNQSNMESNFSSIAPSFIIKSEYKEKVIWAFVFLCITFFVLKDELLYLIICTSLLVVFISLVFLLKKTIFFFDDHIKINRIDANEIPYSAIKKVRFHKSSARGGNILWIYLEDKNYKNPIIKITFATKIPEKELLFLKNQNVDVETDSNYLNDLLSNEK